MPPVRTEKTNSSAKATPSGGLAAFGFRPAPKEEVIAAAARAKPPVVSRSAADLVAQEAPKPKPRLPKPLVKGVKQASFADSRCDWDDKYHKIIGTSTRKITFGSAFELTENLKKISLPGSRSSKLGDQGLIHLISFCQNLTHLEFSGSGVTEVTFEQWIAHPDWAPNLKKLRLNDLSYNRKPMRALREFGRTRPTLPIELVTRSEFKKWDTWYLQTSHDTYKNGRKVSSSLPTVT
ncbi:hypothetical protein J4E85_010760 [Alternaria conjuncta]|uniref:uncharacterized protein n=1 Tax=Alternaria conjuncta TaxID=181017 RepID=UPI00221EEAFF|nr:uncharacterized protein J4E85_010760 [Alternaria conjuncta]KAI4913307.1 hypothetical protein J4E85_010760 [Alternaria conjuncta]